MIEQVLLVIMFHSVTRSTSYAEATGAGGVSHSIVTKKQCKKVKEYYKRSRNVAVSCIPLDN